MLFTKAFECHRGLRRKKSGTQVSAHQRENKLSDATVSPTLKYFNRKYGFSAVQVIKNLRQERISDLVELRKGVNFLKTLKL